MNLDEDVFNRLWWIWSAADKRNVFDEVLIDNHLSGRICGE